MYTNLERNFGSEKKSKSTTKDFRGLVVGAGLNTYTRGVQRTQLKAVTYAASIARVCIEIIKFATLQIPFIITTNKENPDDYKAEIDYVKSLLHNPNDDSPFDTWRRAMNAVVEDILIYDNGVLELVRNAKGAIVALYAVDGSTIIPNINNEGIFEQVAYKQVEQTSMLYGAINTGKVIAEFDKSDLLVFQSDPQQGNLIGYGRSPVDKFLPSILSATQAMQFNTSYFNSSKIPPALANFKGADNEGLVAMKQAFEAAIHNNQNATVWTNAEKLEYKLLRPTNQDMQFMELYERLVQTVVTGFGLSIQDVGLVGDVNRATAQVLQNLSKNRGVSSMLSVLAEEIQKDLLHDMAINMSPRFGELVFSFEDLDKIDQKTTAEIHKIYLESGALEVNEVRKEIGYEPLEIPIEPEQSQKEGGILNEKITEIEKSVNEFRTMRPLFKEEQTLNLEEIEQELTTTEDSIIDLFREVIDTELPRVVDEIERIAEEDNANAASQIILIPLTSVLFGVRDLVKGVARFADVEALKEIGESTGSNNINNALIDADVSNNTEIAVERINSEIVNYTLKNISSPKTKEQLEFETKEITNKFINTTASLLATSLVMGTFNNTRFSTFKNSGVEKFRYSAILDNRTTKYCASLDGQIFTADDAIRVMPPNHFRCRSILVPIMDKENNFETTPIKNVRTIDSLYNFTDSDAILKTVLEEAETELLEFIYGK